MAASEVMQVKKNEDSLFEWNNHKFSFRGTIILVSSLLAYNPAQVRLNAICIKGAISLLRQFWQMKAL